jgi:hypothetical protein
MLKYKQKYLNLKKNIMKGGVRIDIELLKNTDEPINSIKLLINELELFQENQMIHQSFHFQR